MAGILSCEIQPVQLVGFYLSGSLPFLKKHTITFILVWGKMAILNQPKLKSVCG